MLTFSRCSSALALDLEFIRSLKWAFKLLRVPLVTFLATPIVWRKLREAGEACNFLLPVSS